MVTGKILIIEDETRLLKNLHYLLSREGYTVTTANAGLEGIQCLQNASFDVVITDLVMEGFEGFELMDRIMAQTPETPIIIITGYASTMSASEAMRKGAFDYIAKPFEISRLKTSVGKALGNATPDLPRRPKTGNPKNP